MLIRGRSEIPEALATHMITISGIGKYCAVREDARKQVFELPPPEVFDLRDGEPVNIFSDANIQRSETRWTAPYKDDVVEGLVMTAVSSVYGPSGGLAAVTGVDIPLDVITGYLLDHVRDTQEWATILLTFIIGTDGRLILFPEPHMDLFGLSLPQTPLEHSDDILTHYLNESVLPEVRRAAAEIVGKDMDILEVSLDGEPYLMVAHGMAAMPWQLVSVTRESDLLGSISRTRTSMAAILDRLKKQFIGLHTVVLVLALLFILWITRQFVSPIRNLIRTVHQVTQGDLSARSDVRGHDELGQLAEAFNLMVSRLEQAERSEKKAAGAAREVTDTLNSILDSATAFSIVAVDRDLKILHFNPASAQILGRGVPLQTGMDIRKLHPREQGTASHLEKAIEQVNRSGRYEFEFAVRDAYGRQCWVQCTIMPMQDREGRLTGYVLIGRDTTRYKELQNRLLRSDRLAATGQLAASVAHQINSPLQGISSFIGMMKDSYGNDQEMIDALLALERGFVSIRDTVRSLMDLTRPGKEVKQPVDLNHIIQEIIALLGVLIQQSGAKVDLVLSPDLPAIQASPSQLSHVMLNLINNSVEAMQGLEDKKEIRIRTLKRNGWVEIFFEDTGPGFDGDVMDYIFDPFFTTKEKLGMGVGLSVCHGFISNHGGTLTAENTEAGGARFIITLPLDNDIDVPSSS